MDVWTVIPAFNAEKTIKSVLEDLKSHGYGKNVVVDDGSKDKTGKTAEEEGAILLTHCVNRGQGAALRTGIDYVVSQAKKQSKDEKSKSRLYAIVTFDADGQHHAKDIENLLRPIKSEKVDVALGSRFLKKTSNVPMLRKMFLKGGVLVTWLFYGIKLTDSHNGLRVLNKEAAEKIEITTDRMEHASEIVEQIKKKELRYQEVPVTITYTEESMKQGQSTWNSFRILFKMTVNKLVK